MNIVIVGAVGGYFGGKMVEADSLDMRVAAGENEYGRFGFKDLFLRQAADVLQIDVQRVGGITE